MADPAPVVEVALQRPARLGASRLICIDGPSGAGKTTLARLVVAESHRRGLTAAVVHTDDLLAGWGGLPSLGGRLRRMVVAPLAQGHPGGYRRYDWHRRCEAEQRTVPPADLVVLEGVGSAHRGYRERITLLVWVEAPAVLRWQRALERDGADVAAELRRWAHDERDLHERERTRQRADVVVDGLTGGVRHVDAAGR